MKILDWISKYRPGKINSLKDRIEIVHANGDVSTLWFRESLKPQSNILSLGEIYQDFDGLDLFSSTFKIASVCKRQKKGDVDMTFTLAEIKSELQEYWSDLPRDVVPFMIQQGIGIYYFDQNSGFISEFDTELEVVSGTYDNIFEILNEWNNALGELG